MRLEKPDLMAARYLLFLLSILFHASAFAQAPTEPTAIFEARNITGGNFQVRFSFGGGERRIFVISENPIVGEPVDGFDYNPDMTFGDGDSIALGEYVIYDGRNPASTTFNGLAPATTYYLASFEYNGQDQMTEYLKTPVRDAFETNSQPTVQASDLSVRTITGNSATLSWTNGNGDGRLILMREGGPVTANPVDLENYRTSTFWTGGDEIGNGNFVIFNSTSTTLDSVVISRLQPDKEYHFDIFEFNGPGGRVYAVPGAEASFSTFDRPTVTGGLDTTVFVKEACRFEYRTRHGNGQGRLIVLREGSDLNGIQPTDGVAYTANATFGSGDPIGADAYVIRRIDFRDFSGAFDFRTIVRGLSPNTTYTMGLYEFDHERGFAGLINYQTIPPATLTFTTAAAPLSPPTNPVVFENTGSSVKISYDVTGAEASLFVMKAGSPVDFTPEDCNVYRSSLAFGFESLSGGNFGIWSRPNLPTNPIIRLTPGVVYHGAVWAYNGNAGPVYGTQPLRFSFTASLTPSESAMNLAFRNVEGDRLDVGWDVGNGQRRLLIARRGAAVTALPQDGATYDDGGEVFGLGTEIAPGQFVVSDNNYNGTNTQATITGLDTATEYHFALFEFNKDAAGNEYFRRTDPATGAQTTAAEPTLIAPSLTVDELNAVDVTLTYEYGNGERRYLVIEEGTGVDFVPEDLVRYRVNRFYGNQIVGVDASSLAYIQPSTGFRSPVLNLLANTTYTAALFEANGRLFPVYNKTPTTVTFTTPTYATIDATSFQLRQQGAELLQMDMFRGNGSGRIIVAREATSVAAAPQDGVEYTANEVFGMGTQLGNGNFVVAAEELYSEQRRRYSFSTTGLSPDTDYVFTAYETTSDGTTIYYARPGAELAATTATEPTVAPVNLQITDVLNESATVAWTTGNGTGEVVLVSENAPVSELVSTGTRLGANPTFGTSGNNLVGNAQVVFFGSQTTVDLIRLQPGTQYYVQIQSYNGYFQSPAYMQTGVIDSFRTLGPPAIQATDLLVTSSTENRISLAWRKGGGTDRLVVARRDTATKVDPVDGIVYTPNTFFGSGDDLGGGNFVVAAADFDTISVTDLDPGELYCFSVYEYNRGTGSPLYNIVDAAEACGVAEFFLPVTWRYFRGRATKDDIHLEWATSAEEDAARFVVQRSPDGTTFTDLGSVLAGRGNYTYDDAAAPRGDHFYRLRQEDHDDTFSYSEVIRIGNSNGDLVAYPNPMGEVLHIDGAPQGALLELRSVTGALLLSSTYNGAPVNVGVLPRGPMVLSIDGTRKLLLKQ